MSFKNKQKSNLSQHYVVDETLNVQPEVMLISDIKGH